VPLFALCSLLPLDLELHWPPQLSAVLLPVLLRRQEA